MKMLELTKEQFEEFASNSPYNNYCQSDNYGKVMNCKGFNYNFIGYTTNEEEILAAGMFLTKRIGKTLQYAYCPKGFIIDYEDTDLLKRFTNNLIKFYKKKNIIFLKINPEIEFSILDKNNDYGKVPTKNISILDELRKLGFKKRKEIEPLQLIEPKIKAIIDLKKYDEDELNKDIKRKIYDSKLRGLEIKQNEFENLSEIYNLINENNLNYYKKIIEIFKKTNSIDVLTVNVDYETYLINTKKSLEKEEEINDSLNEKLQEDTSEENLKEKMKSDEILEKYRQDVINATNGLKNNINSIVAYAIIVKHDKKITIIDNGINNEYAYMEPYYYLYNEIIELYRDSFDILDLNAIADDFNEHSEHAIHNKYKLDFNPKLIEYIGELDLVISNWKFRLAEKNNLLSQEFTKKKDTK